MRKYEKYKDTDLDWNNVIPSEWNLVSLKFLTSLKFSSVDRHEFEEEIKVSICHYPDAYKNEKIDANTKLSLGTCSEVELESFALKQGQVIITKDSETPDDIGIPTYVREDIPNSVCGYHLAILESKSEDFDTSFLFRYLQSRAVSYYFEINSNGVTRFGLGKQTILNLKVPVPRKSEQTQIARYLDHQTAIIDSLIAKKAKLVALLKEKRQAIINEAVTKGLNPNAKMKDSGIEWLGEVPEDWIVSRIKFVADVQGRVGYKGYTKEDIVSEGEGALTLGAKHIDKENNLNLSNPEYIKWEKYYESPEIMIKMNDVIFTQRGSLGKICHINQDIGKATINPSMVILTQIRIYPRYLYYWLTSNGIQNEVELLQANTAVPMVSQFQLSNFPILLPNREEQILIVEYIDNSLKEMKILISSSICTIKKLKEYRQSIISEAVTGKVDVRDWQPKKANQEVLN